MCLICEEHMARAWYLDPRSHQTRGGLAGAFDNWVDTIMYPRIVVPGLEVIKKRQPYGTERYGRVSSFFMSWLTKSLHGFQVVPCTDWAEQAIDLATDVVLSICSCRKVFAGPNEPLAWKCIGLGNAARVTRDTSVQPFRDISKAEAKDIVAAQRKAGCFISIGWRRGSYANWMCNCDQWCGSHRTPELPLGMVPSLFVSKVVAERCDGCGICGQVCHRKFAITFSRPSGLASIDPGWCLGCGLCLERCPKKAIMFAPRDVYFDMRAGGLVQAPAGATSV